MFKKCDKFSEIINIIKIYYLFGFKNFLQLICKHLTPPDGNNLVLID